MARRVVLATGNAGKLRELRALLADRGFDVLPQSDFGVAPPAEDGATFVANALIKARHAARATGLPAIADDSGLEVDALGGRPGVRSARYAGAGCTAADNNRRLLEELSGVPPPLRRARFRCAMVFVRDAGDARPVVCEAAWQGRIADAPRGSGGFGFDPLFLVEGDSRTAAELPAGEKSRVSHRGQALRALLASLDEEGSDPTLAPRRCQSGV